MLFLKGARLALCDYNKEALVEAVQECRKIYADSASNNPTYSPVAAPGQYTSDEALLGDASTNVIGVVTNVCKQDQVQKFIDTAVEHFHGIDVLLLCAGVGAHNIFLDTDSLAVFHRCMDVNFFGYLNCTHAALPHLIKSRGVLTAITSFSGEVGLPYRTAYCASKFAVTGFLEALRAELKDMGDADIDFVLICPPTTNTNLRANSLTDDKLKKGT